MEKILYQFDKKKADEKLSSLNGLAQAVQTAIARFEKIDPQISISIEQIKVLLSSSSNGKAFDAGKASANSKILLAQKLGHENKVSNKRVPWEKLIGANILELPDVKSFTASLGEVFELTKDSLDLLDLVSLSPDKTVTIAPEHAEQIKESHRFYIENDDQRVRFEKAKLLASAIDGVAKLVPGGVKLESMADIENFLQFDNTGKLVPNPDYVGRGHFQKHNA